MTSHADLRAAIDRQACRIPRPARSEGDVQESAHLDTLRAILALHTPLHDAYQEPNGGAWMDTCECCEDDWPCATVQVVADALTRMGAL